MSNLQGENQIRKFERTADKLKSEMMICAGVTGIIFGGGLVRGYADKYSDVDVTVFLDNRDDALRAQLRKMGFDEQKRSRVDIDLEIHYFDDFVKRKWNEMNRWDYSQAKIVFDPQGKIRNLFDEKLRVSKGFWTRRIVTYAEYIKWYCCPPEENMETMIDAWISRGDLPSAHYCVNYALDLMIGVLFALNREFLPPQKWRMYDSYSLKWLPKEYKRRIREIMIIKSLSVEDLERRTSAMKKLWRLFLIKIQEETGLSPDAMSKLFVEKVLHQTLD